MRRTILRLEIRQMQSRLTRDAVGKRKSTAAMIEVVVMDDTTLRFSATGFIARFDQQMTHGVKLFILLPECTPDVHRSCGSEIAALLEPVPSPPSPFLLSLLSRSTLPRQ